VRVRRTVWLLPIGFVVHDGEELVTMAAWIAEHRSTLDRVASLGPVFRRIVETVPARQSDIAWTIAFELLVLIAATAAVARNPGRRAAIFIYAGLLGVFVAHALTHAGQAVLFRGYTPGVISAVTVVPAVGIVIYRHLFAARLLTPWQAALAAVAGALVFLPSFAGLVAIARRLGAA
jgi:hypothetical protein